MAGNISPKDMETISNGVLDNLTTVDQLPGGVKNALMQYWSGMGIDATKPDDPTTQAQLDALKQQRQQQQGGIFDSPIFKPIEWVGSKLYQVYSSTVSPALSAAGMAAHSLVYGRPDYIGEDGEVDALKDYWNYAHTISPGQSIWELGFSNKELANRGIDPQQIAQDTEAQKKGTYRDKATADDPFGIKSRSQEYFGSGASKYVTGSADFAVSWYADPLVLAGKGLGAAKLAKVTRPVAGEIKAGEKLALGANPALSTEQINKLAWDSFSTKQPFQNLTDHIWNIKAANPDTAAARLTRDVPTLAKGANAPAAAALLSQATSKTEVANILRVTMGDNVANEALKVQNGEIAYQISSLNAKVSSIDNYYQGLSDAQKMSPFGQKVKNLMDQKSQDIARLDRDGQIVTDKIKAFGTIGDLNFNKVTTPAGLRVKDAWQSSRTWQPLSDGGFIKSQVNNIYSLGLGGVIKLAHTYNDIKPTFHIDINDPDSWRQVQASLLDVKGLTPEARDLHLSQYINATPALKAAALGDIEEKVARNILDRYNLDNRLTGTPDEIHPAIAEQLYKEIAAKRSSAKAGLNEQAFGTTKVDDPNMPGLTLRVDQITPDGGHTVITPLLRTQMANSHTMMDFKLYAQSLKANASTWNKAFQQLGTGWEKAVGVADYVGSVWKFSQLFRLGYGPRALSDDAAGQLARFGPMAMTERALKGGKYTYESLKRAAMPGNVFDNAMVTRGQLEVHLGDLTNKQEKLQAKIAKATIENRPLDAQQFQAQLNANIDDIATARKTYSDMDDLVKGGAAMKHTEAGRQIFSPAYAGAEGGLFKDLASGEKNFANMMGSASDSYLNSVRRMDWTLLDPARHTPEVHMRGWLKVLNQQVAHDDLAFLYLRGRTPEQLERWLSTPQGLAYKRNHTIAQHLPNDQLVDRVTAQVDEWANPAFPGGDVIRQAAAKGSVTKEMLEQVPEANRPLVNGQALSYARGSHEAMQLMDRAMTAWYNIAGNMPARYLLRNPLFAQRYTVHLRDLMTTAGKTGERMTEDLRVQFETAARKRALQDVKKNTFTMDYETKMSHMLRNFGAFFGAQQESWNRWARIISDKPDILPRVAQAYGAPTRAGLTTDSDGNHIGPDGYVTDPATGERRLVPYNERHVVVQIPDYLGGKAVKKFFGLDENATFDIPMSTAIVVLNHGDGPLPVGAGPYVQMAANNIPGTDLDANGSPKLADMYQKLGILPFGPTDSNAQAWLPNWLRKANAGQELGAKKQQTMWYIMQAEDYKYREGLRKTAPSWKEIEDRASRQNWMSVLFAAALPISMQAKDPYQFFRDQYKQMQNTNYDTADQQFYDKYGDSAYTFSKSLSKNNSGLKPTEEAVQMSKYYQDLIGQVGPELAGLVVGAEGEGTYSNGAFYYQKTHAVDPTTGVTSRSQVSAREGLSQANLARGWQQYKGEMNRIYSELYSAGFQSFDDPGAEQIKAEKTSLVNVLSSPQILDDQGNLVKNEYYNEDWSKAYNSFDLNYYDRLIPKLKTLTSDPEIWSKAVNPDGSVGIRSDIYTLKTYLSYRDDAKRALLIRKESGGSSDINAQQNADVKSQWDSMVLELVQQDTKFGDLFNRYLSRDMGYDQQTVQEQSAVGALGQFQGDTTQAEPQSIFDVLAQQGGS